MSMACFRQKHSVLSGISLLARRRAFISRPFSIGLWDEVPLGPPDPILGLTDAYLKDSAPLKLNVGVGAFRDNEGKPYVLPSVRLAEEILLKSNLNHEYAPISGTPHSILSVWRASLVDIQCRLIGSNNLP